MIKLKRVRVTIRTSELVSVELQHEFGRLTTELSELQKRGREPKSRRLTLSMVKDVFLRLGLEQGKRLTYEAFAELYEEIVDE